jgi:hypothetical protein
MQRMIRKSSIKSIAPIGRTSPLHGVPFILFRSKRRSAVIRINGDGEVHLLAPNSFSLTYADEIIDMRHAWILKRKAALSDRIPVPVCPEKDRPILADRVRAKATVFLSRYEGKKPKRIFIRFSKTSWGSCSSLGNISLSGYLYYLPDELFEYVLLHELSHLYHLNHSPDFWNRLSDILPDPKLLRKKLARYRLP